MTSRLTELVNSTVAEASGRNLPGDKSEMGKAFVERWFGDWNLR